jgi:hypothetical protein
MELTARGKRILLPVVAVALINFTAFWVIAVAIGGDAVSGKVESGRHYLSSHGKLTEVSRAVYVYSYTHTVSVWVTHPAVLIAAACLFITGDLRWPRPT